MATLAEIEIEFLSLDFKFGSSVTLHGPFY